MLGTNPVKTFTVDDLVELWKVETLKIEKISESENEFHNVVPQLIKDRSTPIWKQTLYCHMRSISQQVATPSTFVMEASLALVAGLVMVSFDVSEILTYDNRESR